MEQQVVLRERFPRYDAKDFPGINLRIKIDSGNGGNPLKGKIINVSHLGFRVLVNSPDRIFQMNQVLSGLTASVDDAIIYEGAVSINYIEERADNTWDLRLSCISSLVDIPLLLNFTGLDHVTDEYQQLINSLQIGKLEPAYRNSISELKTFSSKSKEYFHNLEQRLKNLPPEEEVLSRNEIIKNVSPTFNEIQYKLLNKLNEIYQRIDDSNLKRYQDYGRQELQHHYLGSRFVGRSISKPLGYAGDFIQILTMLSMQQFDSLGIFTHLINAFVTTLDPVKGHMNRIDFLYEKIKTGIENKRASGSDEPYRLTTIGCGPAAEIMRLAENDNCRNVEVTLIDMEPNALRYCEDNLKKIVEIKDSGLIYKIQKVDVKQLIARNSLADKQDLIYCAGLFDYLTERFCTKILAGLYEQVVGGGELIFTNVTRENTCQFFMEIVMEWYLILRNEREIRDLIPFASPELLDVIHDQTRSNLYGILRKT